MIDTSKRFSLGRVVGTPGALAAASNAEIAAFIRRHWSEDWGDVCDEDKRTNDDAVADGARLLSEYRTTDGARVWVITEADRSVTTLLLPEEY